MTLLAEYGFTEGSGLVAADSSGNGRDLAASNTSTSWDAAGKNGAGARTQHTGSVGPNVPNDYTIMCWVKRTGTWTAFAAPFANSGQNVWLEADAGAGYLVDFFGGSDAAFANAGNVLTLDTWVHLAATRDSTNVKIFYNGVQQTDVSVGQVAKNFFTGNVVAGNAATAGEDSTFVGIVDELRIFDTALDAATITTWMNTPIPSVVLDRLILDTGHPLVLDTGEFLLLS